VVLQPLVVSAKTTKHKKLFTVRSLSEEQYHLLCQHAKPGLARSARVCEQHFAPFEGKKPSKNHPLQVLTEFATPSLSKPSKRRKIVRYNIPPPSPSVPPLFSQQHQTEGFEEENDKSQCELEVLQGEKCELESEVLRLGDELGVVRRELEETKWELEINRKELSEVKKDSLNYKKGMERKEKELVKEKEGKKNEKRRFVGEKCKLVVKVKKMEEEVKRFKQKVEDMGYELRFSQVNLLLTEQQLLLGKEEMGKKSGGTPLFMSLKQRPGILLGFSSPQILGELMNEWERSLRYFSFFLFLFFSFLFFQKMKSYGSNDNLVYTKKNSACSFIRKGPRKYRMVDFIERNGNCLELEISSLLRPDLSLHES